MALNKKIIEKVRAKSAGDTFVKSYLPSLLARIEEGKQPRREIEKVINQIK